MNHAKIRAKVVAIETHRYVHVHGCFGEVALHEHTADFDTKRYTVAYCYACDRPVPRTRVVSPLATTRTYLRDVNALLKALDDAEDRIAELEDAR